MYSYGIPLLHPMSGIFPCLLFGFKQEESIGSMNLKNKVNRTMYKKEVKHG